ncbi:iron complex outermembrane receptor protein [Pseudomonas sp. JUb42]|uniref:TonB-dependent siderophore receptor n=1 Tax=Pseudomonas sp. JUb42 TaxID=2940611 RepID=UPI0021673048|nr:TonB-dependent siderophore receptor [Pseudomonas sp. JUb42]MCS3471659.1 iron complex outermembrane receptor protein [Pseudomonas sp. JUb42]
MSRALETLLRPSLLAVAIALTTPLASLSIQAAEQASSVRAYNLPGGSLSTTLNQIASQAGIALAVDPSLVAGRTSAPVQGQFDATGALRQALRGSGLQLVQSSAGSFSLMAAPEGTVALPETTIQGQSAGAESAWGPVEGYVASRTAAGTKTDTALAEAPRSISVATREQMKDRAVQNLDDALRYMPGVTASSYGSDSRAEWLKVRGFEPTQFLDGLALPKGAYVMPKLETWDLERVALLRGPASSVYGQTPAGGMLDMVSRRPEATASHEIQAQVGSYQRKQISFDSTGPIDDEGRFEYRVSGVVRDSGTSVEHIDDKRYNLAPSLTWNIDPDTKLTFLSQFNRDDTGITSQFLPLEGTKLSTPAGKVKYHENLGDPKWEFYDKTYYALGYAFEHRFNDVWQFKQNLRYTKSDLSFQGITAGGYYGSVSADGTVARGANVVNEDISQFAVDNNFQADFNTGIIRHTVLLGLDYQRINHNYKWEYGNAPTSNIINPIYGQDFSKVSYTAYQNYNQKTDDTGLYVQDQMALENWRLTLGGRQDLLKTDSTFYNMSDAHDKRTDSHFSGNAALSYVFDSGFTPYISYAESFEAEQGGSDGKAYQPGTGKQYELGLKYQPPGSDILFTAAVYDLTRENIVLSDTFGNTRPLGEAKVRGLELEAVGNVTENLKLTASYTNANTKMTKVGNPLDKNRPLPLTPENQASVWADYTFHNGPLAGFGMGLGVRYIGETDNIAIGSLGYVRDKSDGHTNDYTLWDGAVHYDLSYLNPSLKGVSVAVNANNLFDKEYLSTCDGFYCYYGDRRNVMASVDYKW